MVCTTLPLEGSGLELSVPREISSGLEASAELEPIDRRRCGIILAAVGLGKPVELLRRLDEPCSASNEGGHADDGGKASIAVGTPITGRPPHRTVRAAFLHTAPTSDD